MIDSDIDSLFILPSDQISMDMTDEDHLFWDQQSQFDPVSSYKII